MNILVVCSRNRWRSPTAEAVWKMLPGVNVRSGGVSNAARRKVSAADVQWADWIFVMEDEHKVRLREMYPREMEHKRTEVLGIPDQYGFMDADLVAILDEEGERILAEIQLPD